MTKETILEKIGKLSDNHILKTSPKQYVEGFADAILNVVAPADIESTLQDKFFIPDESHYDVEAYYAYAAELTVANHIKLHGVQSFALEKGVNPDNETDVDVYFEKNGCAVSVEVKSPVIVYAAYDSNKPVFEIKFAGRPDNFREEYAELEKTVSDGGKGMKVKMGKRKDLTLKDFLDDGQAKFKPSSGRADLNILFIALDDYHSINEWNGYLYHHKGLFTEHSFHPVSGFDRVDVVILSNLKYWHQHCRDSHDWTLKNVFMLPRINRHHRKSLMSESLANGLSVFEHHLEAFEKYNCYDGEDATERMVKEFLKVSHYVMEHLDVSERKRYFPVNSPRMQEPKAKS
jgi:hypothetical protein